MVCPDRGAVDHLDRVVAATIGQRLEHEVPQAAGRPAAILPVQGVSVAEFLAQVAPGRPGAGDPEDRIQRAPMVARGRPHNGPVPMTKGAKKVHSSSLNRPRTKADLHHREQLRITPHRVGGTPVRRFVHEA